MNDREPLPSSSEDKKCGCFVKLVDIYSSIENRFKKHYCKVIRTLHGRDFLAEFLATFVLVVSGTISTEKGWKWRGGVSLGREGGRKGERRREGGRDVTIKKSSAQAVKM